MGAYTALGKNQMLNALKGTNPTTPITHIGIGTKGANKAITSVASTDTFTSTSHGLADGTPVILSGLTGGTGLVVGRVYFIIATAANTFQLANTPGGASVDHTTNVTAGTVNGITEISGGSPAYARKTITYGAAADGLMDDTATGGAFDVPIGAVVDYALYYSASTAGTLLAVDDVVQETFGGQGTYTLTDSKMDLNQAA